MTEKERQLGKKKYVTDGWLDAGIIAPTLAKAMAWPENVAPRGVM